MVLFFDAAAGSDRASASSSMCAGYPIQLNLFGSGIMPHRIVEGSAGSVDPLVGQTRHSFRELMRQTVVVPVRFCDRLPSLCPWMSMKISAVLQSHLRCQYEILQRSTQS